MNGMDLINGLNYLDDDLISDAAEVPDGGKVKGKVKGNANGGGKAPRPQKPDGGGIKVRALVIGICAIVAAVALVIGILFATGVFAVKVAPIYQGMVISAAEDTTSDAGSATKAAASYDFHGDYNGRNNDVDKDDPYGKGNSDLQSEVQGTLQVVGASEPIYYADAGDDIYITVKFYNPDYYVILSFVLTYGGEEVYYANYNFSEDSDFENIIIKLNVGNTPGIIDYAISEIKYVDGTTIKDATIEGDTVVSCGVRASSDIVTAQIDEEETTLTSISFTANISDYYSLIEYCGGNIAAILYDGETIIDTQTLTLGTNTVTFTNLSPDTLYQYAVVAYYDDLSGTGAAINYLYTNAVYTDSVVLFDSIVVGQEGVSFAYDWYSGYSASTITRLTLTLNGVTTEFATTDLTLSNLYSDTEYTLTAYYVGVNGDTESISLTFTTLAKAVPTVEITTLTSEQESINYALTITDTDGVGTLTSVTLTLGDIKQTATTVSGTFSNLLSDNTYTVTAVYTYDLNDGTGTHTVEVTDTIATKAKATPTVEITTLTSEQESINYALTITDTDSVGSLTSVTLTLDKTVEIYTAASGTFSNLLSDNTYTVTVVYTYDLNDGTGSHTVEVIKTIATKAKATPTVDIEYADSEETSVTFNMTFTDDDGVGEITAIGFYSGSSLIESITDFTQTQFTFTGLDSEIQYTFKVDYKYDLNDGNGVIETSKSVSAYTTFVVGFESFSVLNTSAVSEGETIVVQADMYNPSNVTFTAIVVNGETYSVSSVSTSKKIRAEIMNNGQFAGGNTAITISQLIVTVNGKSYTVDVSQNNTAYVFINGELTVADLSVVHLVDGQYEETYYGFHSEQLYYKLTLNNATCYDVYSVTIGDTTYDSSSIIMSDDYQTAYVAIGYGGNGWHENSLSSISYSNTSLDKTKPVDVSTAYLRLSDDSIHTISTADDLLDMDDCLYYKLANDIDLNGYEWANMNNNMYGVFDGNGYTISNMSAVTTYSDTNLYLGLFRSVAGAVINLNITDALYMVTVNNTTGNSYSIYAGGIAAYGNNIVIDNCNVDISILLTNNGAGDTFIGGVAGYIDTSYVTIKDVKVEAVISSTLVGNIYGRAGSIAGMMYCWQKAVISDLDVNLTASLSSSYTFDTYFGNYYYGNGTLAVNNSTAEYTITQSSTVYYGVEGFEFSYSNGEYALTGYYGSDTVIVLPESIMGCTYSIGSGAFMGNTSLTSITISSGVTAIGSQAFDSCTTEIIWADDIVITEIGNMSFYNYKGTSITIPTSVTTIGSCAFMNCTSLTSLTIPASVTSINSNAFQNCTAEIIFADGIKLTEIGYYTFSGYKGTSVIIPDSVTTIREWSFTGCSTLTSIVIGSGVTQINSDAFNDCTSLATVYYNGTESEWENVSIGSDNNSYLTSATIYYYCEEEPTQSGNYWHYVDGIVTVW